MLYSKDSSIAKFLIHATHILNSLEQVPEALMLLERYGFSAQRLPEGKVQISQLQSISAELENCILQQKAATETFHAQWKELAAVHQVHLQAARRCLQTATPQLLTALPNSYAGWSAQVRQFYNVILSQPDYQAKLNGMSISTDELARASQWLDGLTANKDQQNLSQHQVRLFKQQRDAKLLELKRWMEALQAIARVAFRDQPALRTMLRPLRLRNSNPRNPAAEGSSTTLR